jgi:elongation factor Ts
VRFVLGEGIEKEESNFAEEVAAQTGQKAEVETSPEPEAKADTKEKDKKAKGGKKKK